MAETFVELEERRRRVADIRAKAERGDKLTRKELVDLFAEQSEAMVARILVKVNAKAGATAALSEAVFQLATEMMAISLVNVEKRDAAVERIDTINRHAARHSVRLSQTNQRLQERVAALEAATKPRQRVKAPGRRI